MTFGLGDREHELEVYLHHPVRVRTNSNMYVGVLEKIGEGGFLHLNPSVIQEGFPNGKDRKVIARLETTIPTTVAIASVEAVEPLSEGYLRRFVDAINRSGLEIKEEDRQ